MACSGFSLGAEVMDAEWNFERELYERRAGYESLSLFRVRLNSEHLMFKVFLVLAGLWGVVVDGMGDVRDGCV